MSLSSLERVAGNTYVIPAPANIGVWVTGSRATLIDASNDDDAGRQILRLLTERGWTLDMIVCTHSNADHIGGNAFLQKRTGCRIAATAIEAAFIEQPILEPSLLYGGYPMKSLRNKFLMAKPSTVTDVIAPDGPILDSGLEALPLPGHFLGMIGVRTPDDVLFVADSIFSEEILCKYPVFFLYDVARHLETLSRLGSIGAARYVPSHAPHTDDIRALVAANVRRVIQSLGLIERCCIEPSSFDSILERVCADCGIDLDANQYSLVGSSVRSMISFLVDTSRLDMHFACGCALWSLSEGIGEKTGPG